MDEPQLSDDERDNIDSSAQRIMKTCSNLVHDFRKQVVMAEMPMQTREHFEVVTELLSSYLKSVCQIYTEQHIIRVKRAMETQKMSHLGSIHEMRKIRSTVPINSNPLDVVDAGPDDAAKAAARSAALADIAIEDDNQLSPEELQMFESENVLLYNELNSLADEV